MTLDPDRLELLYRTHARAAFRRAQRMLGSEADAHEVVHDVFLSIYEHPAQHHGGSSMSTFLYSAVTHACLNRIRNRKNRLRLLEQHFAGLPNFDERPSPEQLSALHAGLARLPEELAQVAVYYFMDELTHDDIARILGCSRRQVGNLLERLARLTAREEPSPCGS